MSYLSFDKIRMTNLQESLPREILCTNRSGAYLCTTIVGCNIRKYNGLLVVPIPTIDNENHVLLSSLDETIIQHGAEFNLGLHKYQGNNYSPKGNKYITSFEWNNVPTTLYRVGGVIFKKEILFRKSESRLIIRYTLLDAHSATTLRLRPFLAFRSVKEFTHKNDNYNGNYTVIENGVKMCLYKGYPDMYMQMNKKCDFMFFPDWYMGLDYPMERERGYSSSEDLYSPGYFEMPLKKGESVLFSAGLSEIACNQLAKIMNNEVPEMEPMTSFYDCLYHAAHQFHLAKNGEDYIISGYPWFKCRARDFFASMPGLTLTVGDIRRYEQYMSTGGKALRQFMAKESLSVEIYEMEQPDVLLWATWCIQQYSRSVSKEECHKKYGKLYEEIIRFIIGGKHENLFLHDNGLLYANGKDKAITWMNSTIDGHPIVPRSGYIVEFNALWYNALCFSLQMLQEYHRDEEAAKVEQLKTKIEFSFKKVFLNEYGYLLDYVDGNLMNWDVRPNMLFAIALDYSPLSREEKKNVLDICTRELVTPKGIRSLSPKSGRYNPMYIGPPKQRDEAYHQGTAWPWLMGFYLEAYLRVYKMSGLSFIERQLIGLEEELSYHCLGSIPELFDGNPPFQGRGAISFAANVAGVLRVIRLLDKHN
jgi:predicted glycogen debranching enzyme